MSTASFLIVANWKMQLSFDQSLQFCRDNFTALTTIGAHAPIVICPTTPALYPIAQLFNTTCVTVGAQNCATLQSGAFTGEVSALSLAQAGARYCIVGHSERRNIYHESSHDVAGKVEQLLNHKVCPIICIGETQQEHQRDQALHVLGEQLKPIFDLVAANLTEICIAYEPVWSIGTGITANMDYLSRLFTWLSAECAKQGVRARLLYGGSVNENNARELATIKEISGFLIGGASLEFQKLQKIVSCI